MLHLALDESRQRRRRAPAWTSGAGSPSYTQVEPVEARTRTAKTRPAGAAQAEAGPPLPEARLVDGEVPPHPVGIPSSRTSMRTRMNGRPGPVVRAGRATSRRYRGGSRAGPRGARYEARTRGARPARRPRPTTEPSASRASKPHTRVPGERGDAPPRDRAEQQRALAERQPARRVVARELVERRRLERIDRPKARPVVGLGRRASTPSRSRSCRPVRAASDRRRSEDRRRRTAHSGRSVCSRMFDRQAPLRALPQGKNCFCTVPAPLAAHSHAVSVGRSPPSKRQRARAVVQGTQFNGRSGAPSTVHVGSTAAPPTASVATKPLASAAR